MIETDGIPPTQVSLDRARRGALKALREGRVTIEHVLAVGRRASEVRAVVHGHRGKHVVDLAAGAWRCSCAETGCGHVLAVQLVTGHAAAAEQRPATPPPVVEAAADDADLAQLRAHLIGQRGWTSAAFGGRCARCSQRYDIGDPIRAVNRTDGLPGTVWAASCCLGEETGR